MTIGISKERLEELSSKASREEDKDFLDTLIFQCTELNPCIPIESAPKDRPILLFGSSIFKGRWSQIDNSWIEDGGLLRNPNQWTELPEDPKYQEYPRPAKPDEIKFTPVDDTVDFSAIRKHKWP